ncbi:Alpha/Beta hydrolase protein [Aspergillus egyptiacus]|nr:Alpha/Beta hydrolase protein [Aspergillus egyptiacus]
MRLSLISFGIATAELALHAAAASSAGCNTNPTLSNGLNYMTVNGQPREYIIQAPANYDSSTPHRLVIGYHWRDGTMHNVVENGFYGLSALSADTPTIFIAPQGLGNGWANPNGDDITFTDQLVEAIDSSFCIDQDRRFATGWSWGGGMSYSVACSRADVFRAVAVLSGAEISGCDGGDRPIAYFGQHGTHDSVLGIQLGRALRDHYAQVNGCDPANPPEPGFGSGTHIVTDYTGCSEGYPVQWVAFDGDHETLPSDAGSANSFTPGLIWDFFSQF